MSKKLRGNSLMEYVLPMGILLIGAGILTTAVVDLPSVLKTYFSKASGAHVSGSQVVMETMSKNSSGTLGNGSDNFSNFAGGTVSSSLADVYYSPDNSAKESRPYVTASSGDELLAFARISPNMSHAMDGVPETASSLYREAVYNDAGVTDAKAGMVARGITEAGTAAINAGLERAKAEVIRASAIDVVGRVSGGDWIGVSQVVGNTISALANNTDPQALKKSAEQIKCTLRGCADTSFDSVLADVVAEQAMAYSMSHSNKQAADRMRAMLQAGVPANPGSYAPWEGGEVSYLASQQSEPESTDAETTE